jgi:hypothetical protein
MTTIQITADPRFPTDRNALVALVDGETVASIRGNPASSSHLLETIERRIGRSLTEAELFALAARETVQA